ncbi:MAG: excinuclease ABC subunit C [Gammaproteobacteria bacterium]|nr:excinuclease ABC subunit C [Gammaproteobacteria bacterium]
MKDKDVKLYLKTVSKRPGVYRYFDSQDQLLYVGKAKNLKNRVSSYFRSSALDTKTMALVSKIDRIETTITASETEALLLEQTQIQAFKPPYNIIFRDDKSYPYISISSKDTYPRISFHRGTKKKTARYFGPFPSASSVRDSLDILQKVFQLRQCEDSYFKNRTRPCLQYQIKRCSGPCCEMISAEEYADDVKRASLFLEGKNTSVIEECANNMERASEALDYEKAARYRDQLGHLYRIQEQQYVIGEKGDADVIAAVQKGTVSCAVVMYIRGGRILGNKTFFPKTKMESSDAEVLSAFLPQFYLNGVGGKDIPPEIIIAPSLPDKLLIVSALQKRFNRKVSISDTVRGARRRRLELALANADQSLASYEIDRAGYSARLGALKKALNFEKEIGRMECFDVSHSSGEAVVASCVVFASDGPVKADYRRFNIEGIKAGDDYASLALAIRRRYSRLKKEEAVLPDILFVDGGKGQMSAASSVLRELDIDNVTLIGVAKGPTRKAGMERIFLEDGTELCLDPHDPGLLLIQQIRDESHRFAITAHRNRRQKKRNSSVLEEIDGVGPKRRRSLLRHFGGAGQVQSASVEELKKAQGISSALAEQIYTRLHD